MKSNFLFLLILSLSSSPDVCSQQGPWNNPLMICESSDGISFLNCITFQDSSGVPSVIRWKGDTLVAAFQWFPEPFQANSSWDKVAAKFSYDGGTSWTYPVSVTVNGLPGNFQRPFDPTLLAINKDSLRMYFSDGPFGNFDSSITTYSAISSDGVNYEFEQGKRFVSGDTLAVIDPAVIFYQDTFYFQSHIGAPQDGSYHGVSSDGLNFARIADISSDFVHNWLGNFIVVDTLLWFFGNSSTGIWFSTSQDGYNWSAYTSVNQSGGDPTVVQNQSGKFFIIYVGPSYISGFSELSVNIRNDLQIFPNPFSSYTDIHFDPSVKNASLHIYDICGKKVRIIGNFGEQKIRLYRENLPSGIYFARMMMKDFSFGVQN